MPKLPSIDSCTSCMACIDTCAKGALSFEISKDGYYQITADSSKCIECGLCSIICPIQSKMPCKNTERKEAFAVWDTVNERRALSASGGAFAAIAKTVLDKGGVVYGAAIDGFRVKHIRIDKADELYKLQGSKYQQSELCGSYANVKKDLKSGMIVLFSGMSCQVSGLLSFLRNSDTTRLFTVDTICGGISTILPMLHLERSGLYSEIISFRDKQDGWKPRGFLYALKMRRINGQIEDLKNNNLVTSVQRKFC